jgi:alkanesulfonate monooxygenase SsuD/methylene tetrahydromethanopterin reductase-like flavin-dependent oxidoreductase (luciferase family)
MSQPDEKSDLSVIHVAIGSAGDRAEVVETGRLVESLGYGGLWIPEAVGRDAFSVLTEIALSTSRMELGTGIINPFSRTPSAIAQSVASLSEAAGGRRINVGLGASTQVVIEGFHGVAFEHPLDRMRETSELVRLALSGDEIKGSGPTFTPKAFKLKPAEGGIDFRVFIASISPKMVQMAGEVADGWLDIWTDRDGLGELGARFYDAHAGSSTGRDAAVASYCYTIVSDDPNAKEDIRRSIAWYIGAAGPAYQGKFARAGYADEVERIKTLWAAKERDAARAIVSDEMVGRFGLIGTGSEVYTNLLSRRANGTTIPVIRFPDGVSVAQQRSSLEAVAAAAGA